MIQDYMDMDTQKIQYVNESSNTSGYSTTTSIGGGGGGTIMSPEQTGFSMPPSPASSPATAALQAGFSNLTLPSSSPQQHMLQTLQQGQQQPMVFLGNNSNFMNFANTSATNLAGGSGGVITQLSQQQFGAKAASLCERMKQPKKEYEAELRILEYPVEKFRFRYKSEMHGTHGSLNGANSKRTPKTFPEVELVHFHGRAVIRCSLFQTNLESPHSHQLVVRKDDADICDPHDLHVSPERGYVAQFQNMGIIHTAKKFIFEELLKKKMDRLRFELGGCDLSTKQMQELHKETEKEAKDMNLNQVRLCFEAFKVEDDGTYTRIAAPTYTEAINNRKSAQTGELRICRLSIATGSVTGGDDLILLVEKVSKKNIKVRFYEMNDEDGLLWEDYGKFRESDVHHQYAIVCQTPPYKNRDIDTPVEVFIELVRPSDDERSSPPVTFRYKPRDAVVSRKRRRTTSTATSSSGSRSSFSSFELPKTVQDRTAIDATVLAANMQNIPMQTDSNICHGVRISEEFNREQELHKLIGSEEFRQMINSEELSKFCPQNISDFNFEDLQNISSSIHVGGGGGGRLETDGTSTPTSNIKKSHIIALVQKALQSNSSAGGSSQLDRIFKIYDALRNANNKNEAQLKAAATEVSNIFMEHCEKNDDSMVHEIIINNNTKYGIKLCQALKYFKLNDLLNRSQNSKGRTGLHCACLHNCAQYIRPLLGLGCDPNIQDQSGNTALHIAVKESHLNCIDSFLISETGIPINLTLCNDEGLTALHLAIRANNYDVAETFLTHNRNAALVCNLKEGNNALHMAVLQQNLKLLKLVLEGQNIGDILIKRNTAGHTAIDLAKSLGTKVGNEILNYLTTLCKNVDAKIVIKEEEISSSSTEDDDEREINSMDDGSAVVGSIQTEALELVKIKTELNDDDNCTVSKVDIDDDDFLDDDDDDDDRSMVIAEPEDEVCSSSSNTDTNKDTPDLEQVLSDERKFKKLVVILDESGKWRRLAELLKIHHLLILWNDAETMLRYIILNANNIKYDVFIEALAHVDKNALQIIQMNI